MNAPHTQLSKKNRPISTMQIQGSVAEGFESIKEIFEKEMLTKAEKDAQLCIYYKGQKVVDLCATNSVSPNFGPDTLVNIFSSGKSLETLALAHLVDKGLLNYDDKVADHWPEFANNGKENTTIAELMRHEAGLVDFKHTFEPQNLLTQEIKNNSIGSVIESLSPKKPKDPELRRNYHALTRGWLANELFRRVEPQGRTIGEYLKENISGPLDIDVYVGVKDQDIDRRGTLWMPSIAFYFKESFKPNFMGRRVYSSFAHLFALFSPIIARVIGILVKKKLFNKKKKSLDPSKPKAKMRLPLKGFSPMRDREKSITYFNQAIIAQGESASFNANCSARGLAKLAAMLAAGGKFDGNEYFSNTAWQALHGNPDHAKLGGNVSTHFTQGGLNLFTMSGPTNSTSDKALNKGREGFYGWMGLGGSIFQWNPEYEIGFAFVPTALHVIDVFNERGKVYQTEMLKIVNK